MSKKLIIDVRSAEEYEEKHKEGAINIPVQDLDNSGFIQELHKDTPIQVYCHSGGRAEMAKNILEFRGFTNVENLGGMA